ncbi:MAG: patatin-like phospholipase family protein, partial [Bryobacteraceae bacterium]
SYPGLFRPVRHEGRLLVDGAIGMEVPAMLARRLGATHVISVYMPALDLDVFPRTMFQVVNRCFQILQSRTEQDWRAASDLVIAPNVHHIPWDGFDQGPDLVRAGEKAAEAALAGLTPGFSRVLEGLKHPAALPAESRRPSGEMPAPGLPPIRHPVPIHAPSGQPPAEPSR